MLQVLTISGLDLFAMEKIYYDITPPNRAGSVFKSIFFKCLTCMYFFLQYVVQRPAFCFARAVFSELSWQFKSSAPVSMRSSGLAVGGTRRTMGDDRRKN